ncbi:MAG: rhodanese-like domain-containing protein [Bacteroidales bacterium]|jgi:rhodanese-related sulfurtransferase|nr:rhodanese-like domain-containing protein [Bacteroidales bacterium]
MAKKAKITEVVNALVESSAVIIDVLEPEAYNKVHIKNAINVPVKNLEKEILKKVDRKTPVIIYSIDYECPVSRIAAEKMLDMGYENVRYYPGGKEEWLKMDMPVERND